MTAYRAWPWLVVATFVVAVLLATALAGCQGADRIPRRVDVTQEVAT